MWNSAWDSIWSHGFIPGFHEKLVKLALAQSVWCGWVGTCLISWIIELHAVENNFTKTLCMLLSILARPHSSFKLLVLGVADPFLWLMLLPQKKWTDQKGQSDMSPKNILKQLKLWIPKPSAEEWNICSQEWNTITIRSAILVWNTLSCWAACKAMCLIEHSSCDVIGLHHSSVQKVCCFLGSWICQDKQCYNPCEPRPSITRMFFFFRKISMYLRKIYDKWPLLNCTWTFQSALKTICFFTNPKLKSGCTLLCVKTQNRPDLPWSSEILSQIYRLFSPIQSKNFGTNEYAYCSQRMKWLQEPQYLPTEHIVW